MVGVVPVKGAPDAQTGLIEDMGIDHRGTHILMSQEFLHGADSIAVHPEMGRKAMAQGMATGGLVDAGLAHRLAHGLL